VTEITPGADCTVLHDIQVAEDVAFVAGEAVTVEQIVPNATRPEYKYVVLSSRLATRFQLSDNDISPSNRVLSEKPPIVQEVVEQPRSTTLPFELSAVRHREAGLDLTVFLSESETYCDELIGEYTQKVRRNAELIESDRDLIEGFPNTRKAIDASNPSKCNEMLLKLFRECEQLTAKMDGAAEASWAEKQNVTTVNPGAVDGVKSQLMANLDDVGGIAVQLQELITMCMVETDKSLKNMERFYSEYAFSFHGFTKAFLELLSIEPPNEELRQKWLTSLWAYKYFHERAYYDSKVSFLFLSNSEHDLHKGKVEQLALEQAHKPVDM